MKRRVEISEITAFAAIAERSSFVKAATHLGVSRSTLSETLRSLEAKLGVRLLNRTSRSVALTEVGERLLTMLLPVLGSFESVIDSVNAYRESPAGTLRLTIPRPAVKLVIEPMLAKFLTAYPAITLDISVDSQLRDIVRERYDAGIRPGQRVERDMIAVKLGVGVRSVLVASSDYLKRKGSPRTPQELERHNCIRYRFASGAMHPWGFERRGKPLDVEVNGSLITSDGDIATLAALEGLGVARLPESTVSHLIAARQLVPVLQDWAPKPVELFLYYPSNKQLPAPLRAFVDFVKRKPGG